MDLNLAYGKSTDIAAQIQAEKLAPGALIVTSDTKEVKFITADKQVLNLYSEALALLAPKANPTFTGTVTLPVADPVNATDAAHKAYVDRIVAEATASAIAPGVVNSTTPVPASHKAGEMFRVAEAGTYLGQVCEAGDLILCVANGETASAADFIVLQANINGAVTGPASAANESLAIFNGVTGKVIKDAGIPKADVVDAISKVHVHDNKDVIDSYTSTQAELVAALEETMDDKIEENNGDYMTAEEVEAAITEATKNKADKATTLAGYGIADAYTKAQVDGIQQALDTAKADKATSLEGYGIADAYTKSEVDAIEQALDGAKADKATTLAGYGITDAMTATAIATAINTATVNKADKATTLAGYGIGDAYTKAEVDAIEQSLDEAKADKATTLAGYGITDGMTATAIATAIDNATKNKADKATTLAGYGIADAYTKAEVDGFVSDLDEAKADKATTLEGYGITDGMTADEIVAADAKVLSDAEAYVESRLQVIVF